MYPAIIYQQANENHLFGDAVNSVYGIFRCGHALPPSTLWERVGGGKNGNFPGQEWCVEICMSCIGEVDLHYSDICELLITGNILPGSIAIRRLIYKEFSRTTLAETTV